MPSFSYRIIGKSSLRVGKGFFWLFLHFLKFKCFHETSPKVLVERIGTAAVGDDGDLPDDPLDLPRLDRRRGLVAGGRREGRQGVGVGRGRGAGGLCR